MSSLCLKSAASASVGGRVGYGCSVRRSSNSGSLSTFSLYLRCFDQRRTHYIESAKLTAYATLDPDLPLACHQRPNALLSPGALLAIWVLIPDSTFRVCDRYQHHSIHAWLCFHCVPFARSRLILAAKSCSLRVCSQSSASTDLTSPGRGALLHPDRD